VTDYTRPNAQWADSPTSASALVAWHFEYSEAGDVVTLTLAEGPRRRMGAGLIVTGDDGTTLTIGVAEEVNGEVEAEVTYLHDIVHITV
jgi:hypothetical protein